MTDRLFLRAGCPLSATVRQEIDPGRQSGRRRLLIFVCCSQAAAQDLFGRYRMEDGCCPLLVTDEQEVFTDDSEIIQQLRLLGHTRT